MYIKFYYAISKVLKCHRKYSTLILIIDISNKIINHHILSYENIINKTITQPSPLFN